MATGKTDLTGLQVKLALSFGFAFLTHRCKCGIDLLIQPWTRMWKAYFKSWRTVPFTWREKSQWFYLIEIIAPRKLINLLATQAKLTRLSEVYPFPFLVCYLPQVLSAQKYPRSHVNSNDWHCKPVIRMSLIFCRLCEFYLWLVSVWWAISGISWLWGVEICPTSLQGSESCQNDLPSPSVFIYASSLCYYNCSRWLLFQSSRNMKAGLSGTIYIKWKHHAAMLRLHLWKQRMGVATYTQLGTKDLHVYVNTNWS